MMPPALDVCFRGPLASCNYDCWYCPFAKRPPDAATLDRDRAAVRRFVAWVHGLRGTTTRVLFTPWGEAMFHPHYQRALVELSHMDHVACAGIQTNGTGSLDFLDDADLSRLSLWISFHPGEVGLQEFVARCWSLRERGVAFSVGVVGLPGHVAAIERLRLALPEDRYLWVNAYKDGGAAWSAPELHLVDPWFEVNRQDHPSRGAVCSAGADAVLVDGDGAIRRCHFVDEVIGDIEDPEWWRGLGERPCPNATCGCFIGYVHLRDVPIKADFGRGALARNPWLDGMRPDTMPGPRPPRDHERPPVET